MPSAYSNVVEAIVAPAPPAGVEVFSAFSPWVRATEAAAYAPGLEVGTAAGSVLVVAAEISSGDQTPMTYGGTSPVLILGPGDGSLSNAGPILQVFDLHANPPASNVLVSTNSPANFAWSAAVLTGANTISAGPEGPGLTHPSFSDVPAGSYLVGCARAHNPSTNIPGLSSDDAAPIVAQNNTANPYNIGVMGTATQQPTATAVNWTWTQAGDGTCSVVLSP